MDPVAAIGLISNIVQFVDFSWRLLDEARTLYKSTTGASRESNVLELVLDDLNDLQSKLLAPATEGAIPNPIRKLASECQNTANELISVLGMLKVKGEHRKWKSFMQALRSIWKREDIERLVKQVEALRNALQYRLQVSMR